MFPRDPIAFLFSLERLGMKFGLDNMRALCRALDHPENAFPSVLIAGTNGKGSVAAMLSTALQAAGHRSGRYTSPHLVRLEERFVIDGREVETETLAASAGRIRTAVESLLDAGELDAPPTFFECTTAVAFDLFRRAGVRMAVLEVGLGGRLDATNVVSPLATAITSIGFDHEALLGHTLASIAREKAGIIKPGVPIVCGPLPAEALAEVRAVAAREGSATIMAMDAVSMSVTAEDEQVTVDVRTARRTVPQVTLGLRGRHQVENAAVAVSLLEALESPDFALPDDAVRAGLSGVHWPGRLEYFRYRGRDVILDAAHNPAGAVALAAHLQQRSWRGVALVFGAMQDKNVAGILEPLLPLCSRLVCTTPDTPRAMPADRLAELAAGLSDRPIEITAVPDPEAALSAAVAVGAPVVVAGSIFLAGPLRDILR